MPPLDQPPGSNKSPKRLKRLYPIRLSISFPNTKESTLIINYLISIGWIKFKHYSALENLIRTICFNEQQKVNIQRLLNLMKETIKATEIALVEQIIDQILTKQDQRVSNLFTPTKNTIQPPYTPPNTTLDPSTEPNTCHICKRKFKNKRGLKTHTRLAHHQKTTPRSLEHLFTTNNLNNIELLKYNELSKAFDSL